MMMCVKVQLVQLTRQWSVESEVLVRTCASCLLDSQLHNICSGLEKMGGNLKKRRMSNMKGLKKSGQIIKILSGLWSYCLWLPTHPTPKPRLTCWNLKESPHHLPEEICSSVAHEICPALSLISFFKLRRAQNDALASITSRRGFHSIWFSAQEAAFNKGSVENVCLPRTIRPAEITAKEVVQGQEGSVCRRELTPHKLSVGQSPKLPDPVLLSS